MIFDAVVAANYEPVRIVLDAEDVADMEASGVDLLFQRVAQRSREAIDRRSSLESCVRGHADWRCGLPSSRDDGGG